jgi:hypothetical protein
MSEHKISKWQDEDGSDFIADVSSSNIAKRKGVLMYTAMKRCRLKRYNFKIRNKMSKENEPLGKQQNGNDFIADVSTRLFGVYDRNGNIQSTWKSPYNAFEEATYKNKRLGTDEYFINWVIVG